MDFELPVTESYAYSNCERLVMECEKHIDVFTRLQDYTRRGYEEMKNPNLNYSIAIARYESDVACALREINLDYMNYRRSESDLAVLSPSGRYSLHLEESKGFFATIIDKIKAFFKWIWDGLKALFGIESDEEKKKKRKELEEKIKEFVKEREENLAEFINTMKKEREFNIPENIAKLYYFMEAFEDIVKAGLSLGDVGIGPAAPYNYVGIIRSNKDYQALFNLEKSTAPAKPTDEILKESFKEFKKGYESHAHSKGDWVNNLNNTNKNIITLKAKVHPDTELVAPVGVDLANMTIHFLEIGYKHVGTNELFMAHANISSVILQMNKSKEARAELVMSLGSRLLKTIDHMEGKMEEFGKDYFKKAEKEVNALIDEVKDKAEQNHYLKAVFMVELKMLQQSAKCALMANKYIIKSYSAMRKTYEWMEKITKETGNAQGEEPKSEHTPKEEQPKSEHTPELENKQTPKLENKK